MTDAAFFLHITDTHITGHGVPLKRDDHKGKLPAIAQATREAALDLTLNRVSEHLQEQNRRLDAVIFSGDASLKGDPNGHRALFDLLIKHLSAVGISAANIVATPGNHDVPKGKAPGSAERYADFLKVWRDEGCITPWLDGIDDAQTVDPAKHRLVDAQRRWAIFPINSANWSHVDAILPAPLKDIWPDLHTILEKDDSEKAATLRKQLDALAQFDMARVSEVQLEVLRDIVSSTPAGPDGRQVRMAVLHHHLSAPSVREEVKAFADFTNLELLRRSFRDRKIDIAIHGHKHEHAGRFDYIYGDDGEHPRRTLVLSGATFDEKANSEAARLLTLSGLPFVPTLSTQSVKVPRGGMSIKLGATDSFRLWSASNESGGPVVIQGDNLDELYHQACVIADQEAKGGTLIVHLDLKSDKKLGLPASYPLPDEMTPEQRATWFQELVDWWQQDRSQLDQRVPYIHGNRLHRFAGSIDQIARIRRMLESKRSSRILATLIDPAKDFKVDGIKESFASFCLVQFRRQDDSAESAVDVIGYYRAQEFARWWPINVAELRSMQLSVISGTKLRTGRITTITAEARSIGRSPTQVAMPVIDRWLDQHPERLHILANMLKGTPSGGADEGLVALEWFQTLDDLEAATAEFNPDGLPVAIEGIEILAKYLEAASPKDDVLRLLRLLQSLIRANRSYAETDQKIENFKNWLARDYLSDLRSLSQTILQDGIKHSAEV